MAFERRSRIAAVYHVILPPCMSRRLIEVGKNWLLAFFWSMLVLTWRESGSIEKHNGFWPPSQNRMCFTGRRDCATATCKTQWIRTRRTEFLVFSMDRELALFPLRCWSSSQLFVCLGFAERVERFAWFCSGATNVSEMLHFAEVNVCHLFQISSHLSAELADLQNVDYLSMCFRSFVLLVL